MSSMSPPFEGRTYILGSPKRPKTAPEGQGEVGKVADLGIDVIMRLGYRFPDHRRRTLGDQVRTQPVPVV